MLFVAIKPMLEFRLSCSGVGLSVDTKFSRLPPSSRSDQVTYSDGFVKGNFYVVLC
jgi:hypothetical protein